jgi:glycosyltransferase involved in cell wall biosynthesis
VHVGLNLAFLVPGESGGRETHARELTRALAKTRPELRLTSFVGRDVAGDPLWSEVGRVVALPVSARSRPQWAWAELAGVPVAAARAGVDLLHSPANLGPVGGPFARVLTLHDLLYRRHPELLTRVMRWGTGVLLPAAARRAHRVLTVSRASRDEIVAELGIPREGIDVVPNGVASPRPGDAEVARALLRADGRRIALAVASDLPHKNLGALLHGLALVPREERPLLALAGHGTDGPRLREQALSLSLAEDVRPLGAVTQGQLENLYSAAELLVSATRYEGFGIPLVEAMARGVPVACSDLPVLREVAGDAACWLDPDEPATVAAALRRVLGDEAEAARLRERGLARARRFSWEAAAEATAASYEAALSASRER